MTDDHRFTVTFFPDEYAYSLSVKETTLAELHEMVVSTSAAQKSKLPWLKLARFGDKRSNKSLRNNDNVEVITGIELDYDGEKMTFDEAVAIINQARLTALLYTSPSHTPSAPRWRAILPTSHPLPPEMRDKFVARVNGIFGGTFDGVSFTKSQAYYFGYINGNGDHRAEIVRGDYIDERTDLDVGARGKKNSANFDTAQPQRDDATNKQADPDLVYAAMAVIPNDDAGWFERNDLGMACWNATNGHERGFEAFDMWCRKSATKYDEVKTCERWQHYFSSPPDTIGAGTLFQKADQAQPGWRSLRGLPIEKITGILRLAELSLAQYDTERKEAAKQLGFSRVSTLDDIVGRLCSRMTLNGDDDSNKQGGRIEFETFEPWPDAVDGEVLIADMIATIRNHVILTPHQALTVALWIIHTHAVEVADHTPRLQIRSPVLRCGKSTLLNAIKPMCSKPLGTENITTASLFRLIEMYQPTLLIDEADSFLKRDDGRDHEELRGILNAGHGRSGVVIRTVGEDFEPRAFKVFGPVAYAWLVKRGMHVAQTLEDRSITIELRRRLPNEEITRLRSTRTNHLRVLGRRIARWVADNKSSLADAEPSLPEQLSDRAQDNWRPLITLADVISTDLGQTARHAALKLAEENIGGEDDAGTLVLADVAAITKRWLQQSQLLQNRKGIPSAYLIAELVNMADRQWMVFSRGTALTEHSLARLLKPFSLFPKKIRQGRNLFRGYVPLKVLEAAERYVVEEPEEVEEEAEEDDSTSPT
jgi:hypothetical protein